jgi:hypothetical protein
LNDLVLRSDANRLRRRGWGSISAVCRAEGHPRLRCPSWPPALLQQ